MVKSNFKCFLDGFQLLTFHYVVGERKFMDHRSTCGQLDVSMQKCCVEFRYLR